MKKETLKNEKRLTWEDAFKRSKNYNLVTSS